MVVGVGFNFNGLPPPRPAKFGVLVHANHGPKNYKDTKPSMPSLLVLNRAYILEIKSVTLVFSTSLVN
jgi:hypothetical protein